MHDSERVAYLGTRLPPLPQGAYYHLAHVGRVRPHLNAPFDHEALVSFQAKQGAVHWSLTLGLPLAQRANLRHAASWQAGSVWNAEGEPVAGAADALPDQHIFSLKKRTVRWVIYRQIYISDTKVTCAPTGTYLKLRLRNWKPLLPKHNW
jgi:hypothetical protein